MRSIKPRLLVKMPPGRTQLRRRFGNYEPRINISPLFESIQPAAEGRRKPKTSQWHILTATIESDEVNVWDLCHELVAQHELEFAEPDIEQQWTIGEAQQSIPAAGACDQIDGPDIRLPMGEGEFWFSDAAHSQLDQARKEVGQPKNRICIAHLDTGYDPAHTTRPRFLRTDLQKNFVDDEERRDDDATDQSDDLVNNFGHGTGTLGILAGAPVNGTPLGGAPALDVIPIRVANSAIAFRISYVAKAFDYIHSLANTNNRVDVINLNIGGLASQAWAEAVNALYEVGVFIVAAAGNNLGNFPTHNIVFPARFGRVLAACGVMADGRPYADLPVRILAGNYGPPSKMSKTAMAAYSPNLPWARLGCPHMVAGDGRGTSAAAPQIAAAAALWIQKFRARLSRYSERWMVVEATKRALFDSAQMPSVPLPPDDLIERLGGGVVQAQAALAQRPAAEKKLDKQPEDSASFELLRLFTGPASSVNDTQQRMLELEALQLTQRSQELEQLLSNFRESLSEEEAIDREREKEELQQSRIERQRFVEALAATPGASRHLRQALGNPVVGRRKQLTVPAQLEEGEQRFLSTAINPPVALPVTRPLRVFAFDPLIGIRLETMDLNETTLELKWEKVEPGPVGNYLEVVDVDPSSGAAYAPVDLNLPLLSQSGLPPTSSNPQFHQQMCYAVAMKTIGHFEKALGRVALWAPRIWVKNGRLESQFVQRLRIYPHALREANAYYSPNKAALLFGYFQASESEWGENIPGQTIFSCLSHDIVAHETTHALLDGLHRRFREPTNPDVLAFHEAFADIVALFQHFTVPEALRDQIAQTRGDLTQQTLLGQLAQQFGRGVGRYGALRDAIGEVDNNGTWRPHVPSTADYRDATEAHDRGAVLVSAVFEAFLSIYRKRSVSLVRMATGGTGVLPPGELQRDLIEGLARAASKTAEHVLNICIRALDYCPPVDMTFGDYVRALITADRDLVPDDDKGYRVAFIQAFSRRGIYPELARDLSTDSVCWNSPVVEINIGRLLEQMSLTWDLLTDRKTVYENSRRNSMIFNQWIKNDISDKQAWSLGIYRTPRKLKIAGKDGELSPFEVHSVRRVRRSGPDGQLQDAIVVELIQSWRSVDEYRYRGGSTVIIDSDRRQIRYVIRKRVGHAGRVADQQSYRIALADATPRSNYYADGQTTTESKEPFALLHHA